MRKFHLSKTSWIVLAIATFLILLVKVVGESGFLEDLIKGKGYYDGRPNSYWRDFLLKEGQSGNVSDAAQKAFKNFRAIPLLCECMDDPDRNVRWPAVVLIRRFAYEH